MESTLRNYVGLCFIHGMIVLEGNIYKVSYRGNFKGANPYSYPMLYLRALIVHIFLNRFYMCMKDIVKNAAQCFSPSEHVRKLQVTCG